MSKHATASFRAASFAALFGLVGCAQAQQEGVTTSPPAFDEAPSAESAVAVAVLAGGCFWGVQGVYQHVTGVLKAIAGYAGGAQENAKYELVGNGDTGHAETVQILYDRSQITYGKLLQIYFSVVHDPTQLNAQGPDHGPQYRSTVFPVDAKQREIAEKYIAQLEAEKVFRRGIVTTLEDGRTFYPAEAYHQDFLVRNPTHPYIVVNDLPKVRDLAALFPDVYRGEPVLVAPKPAARRGG
jgi:peptide-methionine (S)-S-oxide reductase